MENAILDELKKINAKIDDLEAKINILIENNKNIERDTTKMKNHIDFVETTYSSIRNPLAFIKEQIDYIIGNDNTEELPQITNINRQIE